jgi:hypothetical protein
MTPFSLLRYSWRSVVSATAGFVDEGKKTASSGLYGLDERNAKEME